MSRASPRRSRPAWNAPSGTSRPIGATSRGRPSSLHLEDLALAAACADGHDAAWDHFIREHRPGSTAPRTRSIPSGGARSWPTRSTRDLYGLQAAAGERRSLLAYYHGRSALGTWLRAVLAQRVVDRARAQKRLAPLPDEQLVADRSPRRIPSSRAAPS